MTPPAAPGEHPPVVWITGAAGELGRHLVDAFHGSGWRVAATTHRSPLATLRNGIFTTRVDVTHATSIDAGRTAIVEQFGRLDVLVHSAGLARDSLITKMSLEDWEVGMNVNLRSAFLCSRSVAATMAQQRCGQIIFLSSFAAKRGHVGQSNYVAAKAGLIGLTQSLAKELGPDNTQVNAILPGVMPSRMTSSLNSEQLEELKRSNALKRLNDPREVAKFICFLAGMKNVSGQLFQLDSRISRWS